MLTFTRSARPSSSFRTPVLRSTAGWLLSLAVCGLVLSGCTASGDTSGGEATVGAADGSVPRLIEPMPEERFFGRIVQLTDGGENAEAYFSRDGSKLIFQSARDGRSCDQMYTMNVDGSDVTMVSNGEGKTTCGYFYDNDQRIVYSSTSAAGPQCPVRPDMSQGYVWGLDQYDIYTARADGSDIQRLTHNDIYTAEATLSPDGQTILFTSLKDGDVENYTMNVDGTNERRLTNNPGYDGGAFFSPDGSKIVYRAWYADDPAEMADYRRLLEQSKVRPNRMEIWVMDADGSNQRKVTDLGGANFAPFFTPDGERIIFSSNHQDPTSRNFDLFIIGLDGSNLQQVTFHEEFDGFPMFSPDGTKLVWASNRNAGVEGETNVFMADWVE